jgi:hypothetical protein
LPARFSKGFGSVFQVLDLSVFFWIWISVFLDLDFGLSGSGLVFLDLALLVFLDLDQVFQFLGFKRFLQGLDVLVFQVGSGLAFQESDRMVFLDFRIDRLFLDIGGLIFAINQLLVQT